jgi:hypothetical protein
MSLIHGFIALQYFTGIIGEIMGKANLVILTEGYCYNCARHSLENKPITKAEFSD